MFSKIKHYQKRTLLYAAQLRDLRVLGLAAFLVILLLVTWSGVKVIETNYALQKQISTLKQENAVKKLVNSNLVLQNEYYNSHQYLDIAARQNFGLAAPGETVLSVPRSVALSFAVDLPQSATKEPAPADKQSRYQKNFQAWMDFLFHRGQKL